MEPTTLAERALTMQGFAVGTDPAFRRVQPLLRVTPALSTLWVGSGTALGSAPMLLGFAAVSALGAAQRKHPVDRLVDVGLRRLGGRAPLPDNPPPRRFAMAVAAAWAATTAALFATGHRRAALVAGALFVVAGGTVATTHVCLGSWMYRQLERLSAPRRRRAA